MTQATAQRDGAARPGPGGTAVRPPAARPTRPPGPPPPPPGTRGWLVTVLVLVVGNFMAVLDITIVNVAVPAIQKDFGGSQDDVLWIATAYTLMLGVVVPLSGWLGDRFGLKQVYLWSLIGFGVGSGLCALAWSLDALIAFRVLQAVPGGIMPVVAMTLIYRLVPRDKIGVAMGVFGIGTVFAPAVGPVLGGYLVQYVNWRLVFDINVPAGLLGALAAYLLLPTAPRAPARPFDVAGFVCIAAGLFAVLLAASEGEDWGWTGYRILMLVVFGVLALALFVIIELEVRNPLLDLRVLRNRQFTRSLLLLAVLQMNLLSVAFYVPVFLQQGQQKQAFDAGILLLPQALVTGVMMPVVGRLYDRLGPRWLAVPGLAVCGFGTYLLASTSVEMTRGSLILWTCVRAVGLGLSLMPVMTAGLSALPPRETNQGSAMNNVARQVSGALGLALLGALATIEQAQILADRGARATGPVLAEVTRTDLGQAYGMRQHLQGQVLATSFDNLFLATSAVTVASVLLAVFLRSGKDA